MRLSYCNISTQKLSYSYEIKSLNIHEQQVPIILLYIICVLHDSVTSATELDLDYLERRGGNTITYEEGNSKEENSPADTLDRVKVIFLGAPGVGKTSIIRVRFNGHNCISHLDVLLYILREAALYSANLSINLLNIKFAQLKNLEI